LAKPKILIVDDDPDILLFLRIDLEAEGYATVLASDGDTALKRVEEEHPDLVLLDVMMPVLDGWAALEAIGSLSGAPKVIVLSAKSSERDFARARDLGAHRYVTKPFEIKDLMAAIRSTLNGSAGS